MMPNNIMLCDIRTRKKMLRTISLLLLVSRLIARKIVNDEQNRCRPLILYKHGLRGKTHDEYLK